MNRYKFESDIHLHTLDGKALHGTSSVTKVLDKPLSWWASGKAMNVMGWINSVIDEEQVPFEKRILSAEIMLSQIKNMTPEEYLILMDKAYRAHKSSLDDSATAGTDLHAELEKWIKSKIAGQEIEPHPKIMSFVEWSKENVKRFLWSELYTYSEKHWVGGCCDNGLELKDGRIGSIDFKSAKVVYKSHVIQDAGYVLQLEESGGYDQEGNKIFELDRPIDFLAVVPFGAKDKTPRIVPDVLGYKKDFLACLHLYKRSFIKI